MSLALKTSLSSFSFYLMAGARLSWMNRSTGFKTCIYLLAAATALGLGRYKQLDLEIDHFTLD